jgi:hypothetical protein
MFRLTVQKLWGSLRFQSKFKHAINHCQWSKICWNCPKLPKFGKKQLVQETLKFHQKLRFLFFPCIEGTPKHVHTVWIFNTRIFHMPFSMSKNGLCMWILAYPFVQNDVFFKVPYISWVWDFVYMYLANLGTRIWNPSIHTYSKKMVFLALKTLLYPLSMGNIFFPILNLMILQRLWNECVSIGGHVNIQDIYKSFQLEIPKKDPILHNPICF